MGSSLSSQYIKAIQHYRPIDQFGEISRILGPRIPHSIHESLQSGFQRLMAMERRRNALFLRAHISLPSTRIIDSLVGLQAAIDAFNPPDAFVSQALRVQDSFQAFARSHEKYLSLNEPLAERALTLVDQAGEMVTLNHMTSTSHLEYCEDVEEADEEESSDYPPNLFAMLSRHVSYVYRIDFSGETLNAIENSIPNQVNSLGCYINKRIYQINTYSEAISGQPIFKPTTKNMRAASEISTLVASDEMRFAHIVDQLFFLIYEASGTAGRITGLLSHNQLMPAWIIKHLRCDFRHDLDHGSGVQKKLVEGGNAFVHLINKPKPFRSADWKKAQVMLYRMLAKMLDEILYVLDSSSTRDN